ncbi:hypothetical protein OIDMADRAFT_51505 [Oidiodendron maius Zn]|uniref:Uncharacterized protein n=1 Tax=Oidiodendron maius (strain Zn) TaxID=913774 RepID=A0A0C3HKE0_OIDMZ|nr:hypothetical protein OIDMADRAFT_51505 [Oidiodendron maius Zn]
MATTSMEELFQSEFDGGQTRSLIVQFDNWKWRNATILDANTKTVLYRLACHMRKPQLIMHSVLENENPATDPTGDASFHSLSSRITIRLHGQDFDLTSRGMWKDGYTYASPTRNGEKMTWKGEKRQFDLNIVCLDEKALPVARTSFASWSMTKAGIIELADKNVMNEGPERDEIVLTALAMAQQRLTGYVSATSAAGVAASGV